MRSLLWMLFVAAFIAVVYISFPSDPSGQERSSGSSPVEDTALTVDASIQQTMQSAIEQRNTSLCETLGEDASRCNMLVSEYVLLDQVIDGGDIQSCTSLSSVELQAYCSNEISMQLALSSRDVTFCERLSQPSFQEQCRSFVSAHMLAAEGDNEPCLIVDASYRDQCIQSLQQ